MPHYTVITCRGNAIGRLKKKHRSRYFAISFPKIIKSMCDGRIIMLKLGLRCYHQPFERFTGASSRDCVSSRLVVFFQTERCWSDVEGIWISGEFNFNLFFFFRRRADTVFTAWLFFCASGSSNGVLMPLRICLFPSLNVSS